MSKPFDSNEHSESHYLQKGKKIKDMYEWLIFTEVASLPKFHQEHINDFNLEVTKKPRKTSMDLQALFASDKRSAFMMPALERD